MTEKGSEDFLVLFKPIKVSFVAVYRFLKACISMIILLSNYFVNTHIEVTRTHRMSFEGLYIHYVKRCQVAG